MPAHKLLPGLCAAGLQLNLFLAVLKSRFASAQALFHEARKKQRAQRRLRKRMMAMAAAGRLRPDDPRLLEQVSPLAMAAHEGRILCSSGVQVRSSC
jgi:hypothetical protein